MTIDSILSELRAALATLSALHAQGSLNRADVNAVVAFVEDRCAEIEAITGPAASTAAPFGTVTLPVLTLAQVAAAARAEGRRGAGRQHLRAVTNDGDAA